MSVDVFMEEKHMEPIRAGGKKAKDFEISAPMWGMGHIAYFPDHPHLEFYSDTDDEDGYPITKWKKIEAEYIARKKAEDPNFVYKRVYKSKSYDGRFADYPDRPRRYRYWFLETDYVPPSKWKK